MTNRLMISVAAAALIAGTGFANAQGTGMGREAPSTGSAVQQSAPSSERGATSAAPMNRESTEPAGRSSDMKSMQSDEKTSPNASKRAQDDIKAGARGEKSAQDNNMKGEKSKSMSSETNEKGTASKDMKADGRDTKSGGNMNADSKTGNMNAQTKGTTDRSQTTTGNAATSATAAPPAEKRGQIVSAIKSEKVQEVTNVNFSISVGATVPTTVRFYPLPARIVEIYPEWRGYDFILVHGRYIILRPETHEIVYIIES